MTTLPRIDTIALSKALIGFDRVFDTFESRFSNQLNSNYPPHNIIRYDDNNYVIELAVAGFTKDEISVEVQHDRLEIKGTKLKQDNPEIHYMHRGLSARDFSKQFSLAEHIIVKDANIDNGILTVMLERIVPDEMKVRTIEIQDKNRLTSS